MTPEDEKYIQDWLNGDIYLRNGIQSRIPSKDTDYDKMVEAPDYVFQDQAYIPESPMDPYEYYHTKALLPAITIPVDCSKSIGGTTGTTYSLNDIWFLKCKMFRP